MEINTTNQIKAINFNQSTIDSSSGQATNSEPRVLKQFFANMNDLGEKIHRSSNRWAVRNGYRSFDHYRQVNEAKARMSALRQDALGEEGADFLTASALKGSSVLKLGAVIAYGIGVVFAPQVTIPSSLALLAACSSDIATYPEASTSTETESGESSNSGFHPTGGFSETGHAGFPTSTVNYSDTGSSTQADDSTGGGSTRGFSETAGESSETTGLSSGESSETTGSSHCGNGIVDEGEACDENSPFCNDDCKLIYPSCGSGDELNIPSQIPQGSSFYPRRLGRSVATNGNIVAMGSSEDTAGLCGVYMCEKNELDQSWHLMNFFLAWETVGHSVAMSKDFIVFGAPGGDPIFQPGNILIFTKKPSVEENPEAGFIWSYIEPLPLNAGDPNDLFGYSVAISDNKIVVGAPRSDDNPGAVHIVDVNSWKMIELMPEDGHDSNRFGHSVAILGDDEILVGAPGDHEKGMNAGALYIFKWDGNDWVSSQKFTPTEDFLENQLGLSLAVDQDASQPKLIVGSARQAHASKKQGDAWEDLKQVFTADNGSNRISVGIRENKAVVGTVFGEKAGKVFIGTENDQGTYDFDKTIDGKTGYDQMGYALSTGANGIAVGAPRAGENENSFAGSVYLFDLD